MIVYDTDIFCLMQRRDGAKFPGLIQKLAKIPADEIATTIVTFEEQMRGWLSYIAKSRKMEEQLFSYQRLFDLLQDFKDIRVLPYDREAGFHYERLRKSKIRVGSMDLKIASIAMARGCLLLTRNTQDFERIPGLKFEDWTTTP